MGYPRTRAKYPQLSQQYGDDGAFVRAVKARPEFVDKDPAEFASGIDAYEGGSTAGTTGDQKIAGPPSQGGVPAKFPLTTPGEVFSAVPKMAFNTVKDFVQGAAEYPQARLLDPQVQLYRTLRGIPSAMAKGEVVKSQPTPEEAARNNRAQAFELSTALGGPAEGAMAKVPGLGSGIIRRLLSNSVTGAVMGGTEAATREGGTFKPDLKAAVPGAIGGAVTAPVVGEVLHRLPKGGLSAKRTTPKATFDPVAPGISEHVRMAAKEGEGTDALKRGLKTLTRGYHSPEPLVEGMKLSTGEKVSDLFTATRRAQQDAEEQAAVEGLEWWRKRLTGKGALKPDQMDLIRQHATAESFLEDYKQGKKLPKGYTPQQLDHDYTESAIALSQNPEAAQAYKDYRDWYDQHHQSITARGYGVGYQKGYTPIQRLTDLEGLLPESVRFGKTPGFMKSRGEDASLRSSDVPKVMGRYDTQFRKKMAEDDLFTRLAKDPYTNLAATRRGRIMLKRYGMPEGFFAFDVPQGAPGFGKKDPVTGEPIPLVVHRDLAEALSRFYPPKLSEAENVLNRGGNVMAQMATTFNPANRVMNMPSDFLTMLAGPAGEKGTFTKGIGLRRAMKYPGALNDMMTHAFGGKSAAANEGRKVGAVSGTFQKEIEGVPVPHDLQEYYPKRPVKAGDVAKAVAKSPFELMRRLSMGTEAAPRLATQQEAAQRGLPVEEQQRLAHESSLPYGSGSSYFSKSKIAKVLSRFATYPALADVRVAKGLTTPGSITRYSALVGIPPAAAAEWNTQNDEYSSYEKSLKPWVKNSLHVNHKDPKGEWSTYVIRIDPFSEATNRWGVGQLTGRMVKAAKGVEDLSFKDAPKDIGNAYLNMYPLGPIYEDLQGETKFGKPLKTPMDKLANLAPVIRYGKEAVEEGQKHGVKAGVRKAMERTVGGGVRQYDASSVREKKKRGSR